MWERVLTLSFMSFKILLLHQGMSYFLSLGHYEMIQVCTCLRDLSTPRSGVVAAHQEVACDPENRI